MSHQPRLRPWHRTYSRTVDCRCRLTAARALVKARRIASRGSDPLIRDPYAELLLPEAEAAEADLETGEWEDILVTHFVDDALLQATSVIHPEHGEYHQVVLISPGLDTRPFRLPWPRGTIVYDVAPHDVHTFRRSKLQERAAVGSLHVPVSVEQPSELMSQLESHGFRGDRLSVWAIQVEPREADLQMLFVEISQASKCMSLVLGELPQKNAAATLQFLADFSLLASATGLSDYAASLNRAGPAGEQRCVFYAQQQLHSLQERATYHAHVAAAEETDEDFLDNFS